jgi:hypothetical protein
LEDISGVTNGNHFCFMLLLHFLSCILLTVASQVVSFNDTKNVSTNSGACLDPAVSTSGYKVYGAARLQEMLDNI